KFLLEGMQRSHLFVNNDNSQEDPSYFVLNAKFYSKMRFKDFELTPFVGIKNLTNTLYNDNIRINAFGSSYYEPAPERNFYFGVRFGM
ncbi:MAG: TonB-dependent receptor, partial [Saprospiraceae bacterium]|nr:TonB-dependent receptor [Saprospiraceae bacterium]